MFGQQPGFVGALFCVQGRERAVITFWRDRAAVDALATSESYRATVNEIGAAGFLRGSQTTEVLDLHMDIDVAHVALIGDLGDK
jgi:heme-degrading monooxygenase HmoA